MLLTSLGDLALQFAFNHLEILPELVHLSRVAAASPEPAASALLGLRKFLLFRL